MGKYQIVLEKIVEKQLKQHLNSGNKSTIKKIEEIFEELKIHPTTGIGNPEALRYTLSGYWSRRINQKDRIIYKIEEEIITVFVISALGHYGDK